MPNFGIYGRIITVYLKDTGYEVVWESSRTVIVVIASVKEDERGG
jgi:hypothetical protein